MASHPVVIHSLAQARIAAAAAGRLGVPLVLASAPGAAGYAGVAWFGEIIAVISAERPDIAVAAVLDCGDAAGRVMEAVRWCAAPTRPRLILRFTGEETLAVRLRDIAGSAGLSIIRELGPALDLANTEDPEGACQRWLAGVAAAG